MMIERDEAERLRAVAIAQGNFPEVLSVQEAALFLRRTVSWVEKSDVPRSRPTGQGKSEKGNAVFLKSQLIAYLENHLNYRADAVPELRRKRAG